MTEIIFSLTFTWLVGTFFFLIAYDIYAVVKGKSTVSWIVFDTSRKWPIVPFLFGFLVGGLAGHFFFPIPIPAGQ
jgi:hypothetical protein